MAILYKKPIRAQAGIQIPTRESRANANIQYMSDNYDNHLAYIRRHGSAVGSKYQRPVGLNPFSHDRNALEDAQNFEPGYFKSHYNKNYLTSMNTEGEEGMSSLYNTYGRNFIKKRPTANLSNGIGAVVLGD